MISCFTCFSSYILDLTELMLLISSISLFKYLIKLQSVVCSKSPFIQKLESMTAWESAVLRMSFIAIWLQWASKKLKLLTLAWISNRPLPSFHLLSSPRFIHSVSRLEELWFVELASLSDFYYGKKILWAISGKELKLPLNITNANTDIFPFQNTFFICDHKKISSERVHFLFRILSR